MITYTQQDYLNTLTDAGLVTDSNLYGHAADSVQGLTYNSKEGVNSHSGSFLSINIITVLSLAYQPLKL